MPGIYSRHQALFPTGVRPSGSQGLVGTSSSSLYQRRLSSKSSGRTSTTSSERSTDMHDSLGSNFSIPRNSRTHNFVLSPRMSFASSTSTTNQQTQSSQVPSDDWGYFVDCDNDFTLPPPIIPTNESVPSIIREVSHEGSIFDL